MEVDKFKWYKGRPGGGQELSKDYSAEELFKERLKSCSPPERLIF